MSGRNPKDDFEILNRELALYDESLAKLPQIVALNKIDVMSEPEEVDRLEAWLQEQGHTVYRISAATRKGLKPLIYDVMGALERIRAEEDARRAEAGPEDETVHFTSTMEEDDRRWEARIVEPGTFEVVGKGIERMVAMTDLNNEHAVRRLQRSLDKIGITGKLRALGAKDGDTVRIRNVEFDYEDEEKWDRENDQEPERKGRHTVR
jgi:GTP-binding protein